MVSSGASKVIKGGTVITADRTFKADVLIEGEKIVAVGDNLTGDETIDASGCYIMPGGIDPHTHLQMPFMGTYSSDDFDTGTAAALAGGTTMVVDFVLPGPEGNLLDALQEWFQKAGKARTDYSFHMAITGWSERAFNEMPEVVKRGINTFKHFMAYKGALMVNDDEMFASFQRCAELGAMPLVHAENGDIVAQLQAKLLAAGNDGPEAHARKGCAFMVSH
jgi:dihydropyrimidinase